MALAHRGIAMSRELKLIALVLWWIALIGFIAPALVSAKHTEGVLLGLFLLIANAYVTYRLILKATKQSNNKEPKHES